MTAERAYDIIWQAIQPFDMDELSVEQQVELDSRIDEAAKKIASETE